MIKKICQSCSKEFYIHNYRESAAHFCSSICYNSSRKNAAYQRICPQCGGEFINQRETRNRKYCGEKCLSEARCKYNRDDKICPTCKSTFGYSSKNPHQIFCSNQCNIKSRAYGVDENFFDKIDSEGKAYLLGIIFSDGSVSSKSNHINISSNDRDMIEACRKLLKTTSPIHQYENYFCLIISNQNLRNSLINLGVIPRKGWKELSIPSIPKKLIRHFLRGMYDGDGSFYLDKRENNRYVYLCSSLSSASYQFSQEIKNTLEEQLNISFHKIRFDSKGDGKGSYQLRLSRKEDVKKFVNYLYRNSSYFLKRKYVFVKDFYHGKI